MKQTLREQLLKIIEEKAQKKTQVPEPETPKEETKPVRRRRRKVLDDDDD